MNKSGLKKWIAASDWRMWLMLAIIIVVSASLIQSVCSEYLFGKTRQKIIASIDGTEKAIHQARDDAAKQDKVVAVEFDRVLRLSPQVIVLGHKKMDSIRQKMNEEHAHVQ